MDAISRIGIFVEVVKHQSFSGAARALGMSGPAVSKQIQALESQLDVRLLTRTTRHVAPTEEGAVYFDRARKALEDLREAEQQVQELKSCPTGLLRVNAPLSFANQYLVNPIAAFAKTYPDVLVELDLDDRWVDVVGEGYDVVIRIGSLEDSSLIARRLTSCPIILCAAPSLLNQFEALESPDQLQELPGIVYNQHQYSEDWRYLDPNNNEGSVRLNRRFASNTAEMQLAACLQGVGIALLPIFSAYPHLETGDLVQVLPKFSTHPERGIYALFPENRHLATRVRLFVDWLTVATADMPWARPKTTTAKPQR